MAQDYFNKRLNQVRRKSAYETDEFSWGIPPIEKTPPPDVHIPSGIKKPSKADPEGLAGAFTPRIWNQRDDLPAYASAYRAGLVEGRNGTAASKQMYPLNDGQPPPDRVSWNTAINADKEKSHFDELFTATIRSARELQCRPDEHKTTADYAYALLSAPETRLGKAKSSQGKSYKDTTVQRALETRSQLRNARRFNLTDNFVRAVVDSGNVQPRDIRSRALLANLPFENVWLEFNNEARSLRHWELGTGAPLDQDHIFRVGYLLNSLPNRPWEWGCKIFCQLPIHDTMLVRAAGCEYAFSSQGLQFKYNDESEFRLAGALSKHAWGYVREDTGEPVTPDELGDMFMTLPDAMFFGPTMGYVGLRDTNKAARSAIAEAMIQVALNDAADGAGDARFITGALAMLNHVPTTYVYGQHKGRYHSKAKFYSYLDQNTVEINCARDRVVRILDKVIREERSKHRRHGVRGFWRSAELNPRRCRHPSVADTDGKHAICGACGNILTWIPAHERGDATLGYVKHDYEVKA